MSKVIEIYDSDDETQQLPSKSEASVSQVLPAPLSGCSPASPTCPENIGIATGLPASGNVSPPPLIISEVTSINTSPLPTIVDVHGSPATTSSSSTVSVSTSNVGNTQQTKRSRRKSMLHPLCASPEIEFETIALDDDEDNAPSKSKNITNSSSNAKIDSAQESKSPKSQKIAPKNLNSNSSNISFESQMSNACTEFLMADETVTLLREIAENRVRINYLLASYNMPEIQFSLYTQSEVLQFQLDERIKARKSRSIDKSVQSKKRRSLLQTPIGRTGTQ